MKTQVLAIAIALIITLLAIAVPLLLLYNHQPQPSRPNYSLDGLVASLSINSSSIEDGQAVGIIISLINPTDHNVTINAANNWPINGASEGPCGTMNEPIGMAIFSGYYSASNITRGRAMVLYYPGVYACPFISLEIKGYVFLPYGSNVTTSSQWIDENGTFYLGTYFISNSFQFSGFWTGGFGENGVNLLANPAQFHSFQPGVYTVAFADEWGQLKLAHFNVN